MSGGEPRFPNKYVVMGVSMLVLGLLLLIVTTGQLRHPITLWPLSFVVAGLVFLYYRVFRNGPDSYIFLGITLVLSGLLLVITRVVVPLELTAIWPFFMTISGVSLLVYGLRKSGYARLSLVIPGVAALLLSFLFLPFSLGIITRSFAEVVGVWWPMVFVALGIALLVTHIVRDKSQKQES